MLRRVTIWLDAITHEKLKKMGKQQDRSVGWLMRKAVDDYVNRKKK